MGIDNNVRIHCLMVRGGKVKMKAKQRLQMEQQFEDTRPFPAIKCFLSRLAETPSAAANHWRSL
jgi:hypothetical protein